MKYVTLLYCIIFIASCSTEKKIHLQVPNATEQRVTAPEFYKTVTTWKWAAEIHWR